ncbi:MAG TPA: glycosyltransferase family 2 protein [Niabella sp.]|nr:glycosyltransferase family 2 protein [Chitinophagaceae bacterium]HUN01626.1 glycosyltransferase family 2 protein [Niabella sp.]
MQKSTLSNPFISICIPAYNRTNYLKRLLQSIEIQSFTDFEVVISDDSDGDEVSLLLKQFENKFPIRYFKNPKPLGTPENWNEAIRKAKGKWIKLMHDDDWFSDTTSLQQFADAALKHPESFIFSAFIKADESTNEEKAVFPEKFRLNLLENEPSVLLAKNFIGHPSVTLHRNDQTIFYDSHLKWLVDIDYYYRRLKNEKAYFLPQLLIKIGFSDTQVTAKVKNIAEIEIPEHFYFLKKTGVESLRNVLIYDYWWRFIRNFKIRNTNDFRKSGYVGEIPDALNKMVSVQKHIPEQLLKIGLISKILMTIHFLINKRNL